MNLPVSLAVVIASGLYTSLWGAFKDSPYEDFKPRTFPRSIYFHVVIFLVLYALPPCRDNLQQLVHRVVRPLNVEMSKVPENEDEGSSEYGLKCRWALARKYLI